MRVGLVGMGVMGQNHYRILKSMRHAELVAVCDACLAPNVPERTYTDVQTMLESEELEAVIVAVPTSSHLAVAREVIKCGLPVLIEKPIASTVEEAQELIELAASRGTRAAVRRDGVGIPARSA